MTREEALEILKYNSNVIHQTINGETDPKEVEALDMAIKALGQEPEQKKGKWVFIHPLQSDDPGAYMCSECKMGMWEIIPSEYHYCPNCGSYNGGEEDE